jgi:hypothetical protein
MGRKPKPIISDNFARGEKLANSSNRYAQRCNHCSQSFPKGRPETLLAHLRKCPSLSQDEKVRIVNVIHPTEVASDRQRDHLEDSGNNTVFDSLHVLADASAEMSNYPVDPRVAEQTRVSFVEPEGVYNVFIQQELIVYTYRVH